MRFFETRFFAPRFFANRFWRKAASGSAGGDGAKGFEYLEGHALDAAIAAEHAATAAWHRRMSVTLGMLAATDDEDDFPW